MIIGKRRRAAKQLEIGTPLSSGRQLRQQLHSITTFVVDSSSLVKDVYRFHSTWSPYSNKATLLTAAHNALLATDNPELQLLKDSLPTNTHTTHAPVDSGNQILSWSTWHNGGEYTTFWCGDVTAMLHHANLTDTEREQVTLEARKAISRGLITYAVGSSTTTTQPTGPEHTIEQVGLIFVKPTIYPGTEIALQQIKAHGITVVYVSSDDAYTTTTIAHLTGLSTKNSVAVTLTAERLPAIKTQLYAGATPALYKRVLDSYHAGTLAVVTAPLAEFWQNFRNAL